MNFTTHVMLGVLVGAIFFGKPDIILLIGVGSAIPDLDREYGFLSENSFRDHQIHRALCHNYLFLGLLYLVNPFLALGAFLHTLLDALTTAKDRGVEWLYPFTRFAKKALYDESGKSLPRDPKSKVYFYQYDPIQLTRRSSEDLKQYKSAPWRRTYGPALSGGTLDIAIFLGSLALLGLLALVSKLGLHDFIDLTIRPPNYALDIPLLIGIAGIILELVIGEIDRKREERKLERRSRIYRALFTLAISLMLFSVVLAASLNPGPTANTISNLPYMAAGALTILIVAAIVIKLYSKGFVPKFVKKKTGDDSDLAVI
ncbi:MAG: metal-dependent hydrolase [Nitrososphaerales archaeon]